MWEGTLVSAGRRDCWVLLGLAWFAGCGHPLRQGGSGKDGGDRDAVADQAVGPETPDAATAGDGLADVQADSVPEDGPCFLLCPAATSMVSLSGYVDLSDAAAAGVDLDGLEFTVCRDVNCVLLPREPYLDSQATTWTCADAGAGCSARAFGGNSLPPSAGIGSVYAYVTLTGTGGSLYTVGGSVMFPFSSSVADVASTTRITIQSGDVIYLDAGASACTVNLGCCGNLYYQSCTLAWN
jgi:hypothetical protein